MSDESKVRMETATCHDAGQSNSNSYTFEYKLTQESKKKKKRKWKKDQDVSSNTSPPVCQAPGLHPRRVSFDDASVQLTGRCLALQRSCSLPTGHHAAISTTRNSILEL
jgi:hypothetical protein